MGLRKESDKHLPMEKKETVFQRENSNTKIAENESSKPLNQRRNQAKLSKEISKGVNTFKDELEQDDYGVEATNIITDKTYKSTKAVKNVVSDFHKKRKENILRKAEDEQLKSVQQKLGNEIKDKQKRTNSKLISEESKDKNNFLKKVMTQPKNLAGTAKTKGVQSYRESLESDDDGVKVGTKGTELVKDGVKSLSHARKVRRKNGAVKKLKGHTSKLTTDNKSIKANLNTNMKNGQKAFQKKRIIRSNVYKHKTKKPLSIPSIRTATKKTRFAVQRGYKAVKRTVTLAFRKVAGTKVMVALGALSVKLLPVIGVLAALFMIVMVFASMGSGGKEEMDKAQGTLSLDPAVEEWRDLVTEVADEKGMNDYIGLILAIIQIESGGKGTDIMQSSESAGYESNHFQDERESVEQGVT